MAADDSFSTDATPFSFLLSQNHRFKLKWMLSNIKITTYVGIKLIWHLNWVFDFRDFSSTCSVDMKARLTESIRKLPKRTRCDSGLEIRTSTSVWYQFDINFLVRWKNIACAIAQYPDESKMKDGPPWRPQHFLLNYFFSFYPHTTFFIKLKIM